MAKKNQPRDTPGSGNDRGSGIDERGAALTASQLAAALGRIGGKVRAAKLTPEQRSAIARKAGKAGGRGRKPSTP